MSWSWRGLHLDLLPLQARQLLGHIDTAPRQGRDGVTTLAPILLAERDAGSVLIHLAPAPWHDDCELDKHWRVWREGLDISIGLYW